MAVDAAQPSLADRLGGAHVGTRRDLEVSRHLFRDEVSYVLRDPMTDATQRLGAREYRIFCALDAERPLAEHLTGCVERGLVSASGGEGFYRFVMRLHKLGFLKLPVQDEAGIYERHLARVEARKKALLMSVFSARIPLFNPDRFLDRTLPLARPFFGKPALVLWTLLVAAAVRMGFVHREAFAAPVVDIFSGPNLPLLWISLVGLKVVHEFGHGYANKLFGGRVPQMGIMLIAGAPLAYMDATSSWSFADKRKRIAVCLAGMYVEVALAAGAMLLWTVTPPGVLSAVLHNLVVLASVTTVLMNINPLMRYDGYYALCDALELPNLRGRSTAHATAVLKRLFLGIPLPKTPGGLGLKAFYLLFGIASSLYKLTIVLSISAAIASKFLVVGVALGAAYIANTLWGIVKKTVPYLLRGEETADRRLRAATVFVALFALLPVALFGVPLPGTVSAPGLMAGGADLVLHAEADGFLVERHAEAGAELAPGEPLLTLAAPGAGAERAEAAGRVAAAEIRERTHRGLDPLAARTEARRLEQARADLAYWTAREADLALHVPAGDAALRLVEGPPAEDHGRWIEEGEPVATLVRDARRARALFDAADLAGARPYPGQRAWFQPVARPDLRLEARVVRVVPSGSRQLDEAFAEHLDAAELALDPSSGQAGRTRFAVEVELTGQPDWLPPHGATGRLRLPSEPTPLGLMAARKTLVFLAKL